MNRGKPNRGKRPRATPEELRARDLAEREKALSEWVPKTDLGKQVKAAKITSIDHIFDNGLKVMEPEIMDVLLSLEDIVVDVAKTTRVVRAGRKFSYRAAVITGNKDGYVGIGTAKDIDRFPAINKAKRKARLNLKRIYRGSGSWEEQPTEDKHSVPFKIEGKSASVRVILMPAPKGTGLAVGANIKDVMILAGLQNVWGKSRGRTATKLNFVKAAIDALQKTAEMKSTKDIERKFRK
ncbi:MAG: 30S ribosomal protein S5 [Candidatus Diapherotrites archaeon]|jgi:small subunit ribosomal protein S5|uniref:30S ribosomal protein S5 n=1 Tax=Candidatus Iainarchaeum sp. TaxID=3101447 RepID=A0A8T5GEQ5_9ARCH|nr:30S ribosomal protein S5 [Candidatus Diapherotrites archaeon]MBT7241231.1 30S ribosomal protein S5 [Candidatus Diapherotrites archaeon]